MSTPSTTTASPSAPPDPSARLGTTLLVIVTAYLMVGVDSTVVNVALPDIQQDLGFSPTGLSWVLGAFYFLTLISQQVLDYSPLRAGLAFLPMTLAMFTTVRFVPRLLQLLGAKAVSLTGMVLIAGAAGWLWRLDTADGYLSGLLGPLLLLGVGIGLALMPLNATILARVRPHEAGAASGLLQTLQWLGGTLGLSVLVTVYGTATRHTTGSPSETLVEGSSRAFGVGALVAVTALLVCGSVITGNRPRRAD